MGRVLAPESDGVIIPVLDADERVADVEWLSVFAVEPDFAEGGDFARKNCLGCFRKLRPGVRPRRCLSEGLGESAGSVPLTSDSLDMPEKVRSGGR